MSYEFKQIKCNEKSTYDKETIANSHETTYEFTVGKDELAGNGTSIGLFMPAFEDTPRIKALVECCVNLLCRCAKSMSKSIKKENKTQSDIHIEMTHQVRDMANLLQWIINSSSWEKGEYYDFDKSEIKKKIEFLKFYSR